MATREQISSRYEAGAPYPSSAPYQPEVTYRTETSYHGAQQLADRPIRELIEKLSRDGSLLLQQEVALAQTELTEKLNEAKRELIKEAVGGAILYAGMLAVVASVVLLLSRAMPDWLSALLVGVAIIGVGVALSLRGKKNLERIDFKPEQSTRSLKEDVNMVKEAVR